MSKLPLFEDFIPAGFGVNTGQSTYSLGASPDFNTGYNMSAVVGPIMELVNDIVEQSSLYEEDSDPSHTAESYIKEVKKYVNDKIDEAYESYFANESAVTEGIWPKSKLSDKFEFILSDELKKNFKGIFYVVGYDLYHNDKKAMTINPDRDSVNSIIKSLKSKVKESVNEANDTDYDPAAHAERLKRRELQNIQRYRAAQDRGDNYAIALYELKIKMDKIDLEKLNVLAKIQDLKKKFDKI